MKKKIVILGSTGSIGKNTINVIRKNKKAFDIVLLSTNRNILTVTKQAKEFNVKDIIINDIKKFNEAKLKFKKTKFKFHNSFLSLKKILKKKNV